MKWVFDGELNIQDLRPTIKVLIPSTDFIGQKWNLMKLKLHPNAKENFIKVLVSNLLLLHVVRPFSFLLVALWLQLIMISNWFPMVSQK